MSKIVLSEFSEENFVVSFGLEVNGGDNFCVSSEMLESDPFQFIGLLLDYLDKNGLLGQNLITLNDEFVSISGFNSQKSYTEDELRDSCAAEVFVENLYDLFCGA